MKIIIRAFADYREIIGKEVELVLPEGQTIGTLLSDICERYPELRRQMFARTGELKEFINIFINGRNIAFLDNMGTLLVDGDVEVGILPTGQVVGVIEELPTVADLIGRVMAEAEAVLARLGAGE